MEENPNDRTNLVLELKLGEGFFLRHDGREVFVSLLRLKGEKAKLLINAERCVKIDRPYWKKNREQKEPME